MTEPQTDPLTLGRVRFPLRVKLGLAAAILSALPLLGLASILLVASWDTFRDAHKRVHLSVATEVYSAFRDSLRSAQDAMDSAGRALTDASLPAGSRIGLARAVIAGAEAVDHLAVYDVEGRLIDVIREADARPPTPPEQLDEATRARVAQRGVSLDQPQGAGDEVWALLVLPLEAEGKATGYSATWVSLAAIQRGLDEEVGRVFGEAEYQVFLLDDELRFLLHSDKTQLLKRPANAGLFANLEPRNLHNRVEMMSRFEGPDGDYYGTMLMIPERRVAVGVIVPAHVVLGPVDRMIQWTAAFLVAAILLALLASALLARALTRPLSQLASFALRLASRDFDDRVEIDTADELNVLGQVMNRAAEDLRDSEARILEETAIRNDLGRYLPVEVVEKVVSREQDMRLGGVRREVTVLFADVVSFTPLTERLAPEEVVGLLNELFTILTEIVFRHDGMVDKFIGDSVMAVFGAGDDGDDHAERALAAAEDMLRWLEVGNAKWQRAHDVKIELAVGVNTGEAIIGNIGSDTRMEYTAIGEAVNLAARLESVARPQQILVGEATRARVGDAFELRDAGAHKLPGVAEPVTVYSLEVES